MPTILAWTVLLENGTGGAEQVLGGPREPLAGDKRLRGAPPEVSDRELPPGDKLSHGTGSKTRGSAWHHRAHTFSPTHGHG